MFVFVSFIVLICCISLLCFFFQQERIKGKRATPPYRPYPHPNPFKVIFSNKWWEIKILNNLLGFEAIALNSCSKIEFIILQNFMLLICSSFDFFRR